MWELKKNYPREKEDIKLPICNRKKGTTEHVPNSRNSIQNKNSNPNQWPEVVNAYIQNR